MAVKHKRKLIKDFIKKKLTGKTKAGSRVYINQSIPQWDDELPVIIIYDRSESVEEWQKAPKVLKRNLSMAIEVIAKATADVGLSDCLDELSFQVEAIMGVDETFDCNAEFSDLQGVEFEYLDEGRHSFGSIRMIYNIVYLTEDQGFVAIDDLETMTTDWEIGHHDGSSDGVVDAEDTIDFTIP